MAQMSEETKAKLRGRPRNAKPYHEYGTQNDRTAWLSRLDGHKTSRGANLLKQYWGGQLLKPRDCITAMCCECMGYYADTGSMTDCECPRCPLYHYMPYRKKNKRHNNQSGGF